MASLINILAGGLVVKTKEIENVMILELEGEIRRGGGDEPTLHEFMKAELEKGKRNFILNLEHVKFIDSFGLGEILASSISVHNLGGKLKWACLPRKIHVIFEATVISPPWYIWPEDGVPYDTVEAALESFGVNLRK